MRTYLHQFIVASGLGMITLGSASCATDHDPLPDRIVSFPQDYAVGKLVTFDIDQIENVFGELESAKELGHAQGAIHVPEDRALGLMYLNPKAEPADHLDLSPLRKLNPHDLQFINIVFVEVLPEELEVLKKLEVLVGFAIQEAALNDECLKVIADFSELQVLWLPETQVTDNGLEHLKELKKLRVLMLHGTRITDEGLKHLTGLKKLHRLHLGRVEGVTDLGLESIAMLTKLEHLNLWKTGVTDQGMKHLKHLKHLETLNLTGAKITDTGLKYLYSLENLKELNVSRTEVTETGRRRIEEAIPGLSCRNYQRK